MLDTWTQKWPDWKDDQGHKPDTKIDHIFITPDLRVLDARYYPDGPSDHPALTAAIAP
jgi:endonuclease/exonuclease/phosphatase family metal-dependent hydrolase